MVNAILKILWSGLLLLPSATSHGADESIPLPQISRHSPTFVEAMQGDTVVLQVEASGPGLSYRWATKGGVICKTILCHIKTADMEPGNHVVVALVYNRGGSRHVKFQLRIKGHDDPTIEPQRIELEMVAFEAVDPVQEEDDLYAYAREKGAFAYRQNKVERLGKAQRRLDWDEKLTATQGLVAFGKKRDEEHYLMFSGKVALETLDNGRRQIRLEKGVLRSRQLNAADPFWDIIHGDWLHLQGDEHIDMIIKVEREGRREMVRLYVLRGKLDVRWKAPKWPKGAPPFERWGHELGAESVIVKEKDDDGQTWYRWHLLPGTHLDLYQDQDQVMQAERIRPGVTQGVIERTTPQFLVRVKENDPLDDQEASTHLRPVDRPESVDDGLALADRAMAAQDYFLALEYLIPWRSSKTQQAKVHLLMGKAYLNLGFYSYAEVWLRRAVEGKGTRDHGSYYLGMTYYEQEKWDDAYEALELSDDPEAMRQRRFLYKGIAAHRAQNTGDARIALMQSLWQGGEQEIHDEAKGVWGEVEAQRRHWLHLRVAAAQDDNIFRLHRDDDRPSAAPGNQATGMNAELNAGVQAWGGRQAALTLSLEGDHQAWQTTGMASYGISRQAVGVTWQSWGLDPDDEARMRHRFSLGLVGETLAMGSEKTHQGGRLPLQWQAHHWWGKPLLAVTPGVFEDPLPDRDDGFDPLMGEVAGATDRSVQDHHAALSLELTEANGPHPIVAGLRYRLVKHTADDVRPEDFSSLGLGLVRQLAPYSRWGLIGHIQWQQRTFSEAADTRKDQVIDASLGLEGRFWPAFGSFVEANTVRQTSSRRLRDFVNLSLKMGVIIDL